MSAPLTTNQLRGLATLSAMLSSRVSTNTTVEASGLNDSSVTRSPQGGPTEPDRILVGNDVVGALWQYNINLPNTGFKVLKAIGYIPMPTETSPPGPLPKTPFVTKYKTWLVLGSGALGMLLLLKLLRKKSSWSLLGAAKKTYVQAQQEIMSYLQANRWQVKHDLKIPYATSPSGQLRIWFKPQGVWFTQTVRWGEKHEYKDARTVSYDQDIRKLSGSEFVEWIRGRLMPDRADTSLMGRLRK